MTGSPPVSGVAGRLPVLSDSRWAHLLMLALPFAVIIVGCHGLSHSFNAFQAGDEGTHYQIVQMAVHQWPRPLLGSYGAWEGPLVYWLLATLALPFGGSLVAVRLVVTAFSWGTCAITYVLFRDRLHARPPDALALALLLAISPFFFGQSFHVLTDNPTWFFVVLALERLFAYVQRPAMARLAAFAACLAAATLMRQVTLWLLAPGLVALLSVPVPRRRRLTGLGLLVLGIVPLVALLLYWGGPLPPGAAAATSLAVVHRTRNLLLSLGVVGTYGVLMLPAAELAGWWRRAHDHPAWLATLALPAVATAGLLAAGVFDSVSSFLALISRVNCPQLAGVSLLWWVLVPLGAAVTAALVVTRLSDVRSRLLVSALLGLLLSAMANQRWFERYVDFPILLAFAGLAVVAGVPLGRADRLRWLVAGLIAIALFLWIA
jgi:4-amino-4-deoxy-L-arabinose transferase-like glycosyltransferase